MLKTVKKIPKIYLDDFHKQEVNLIRNRIQLAAPLFVFCVFLGSIITILLLHQGIAYQQVLTWIFTICVSLVTLIFARKIRTLHIAKLNVLLFMSMTIIVMTRDNMAQNVPPFDASMIYLFMFFGFSLMFPWFPNEVIGVAILHFSAYTIFLLNVQTYIFKGNVVNVELPDYLEGIIIMFLASCVCFLVIKRERERETDSFILLNFLK